uniref:Uncharacterized protein n=1 Tax=Rhipicephalus zambeziensis TaxID=60191 RepID=A0A224YI84_9ACAR
MHRKWNNGSVAASYQGHCILKTQLTRQTDNICSNVHMQALKKSVYKAYIYCKSSPQYGAKDSLQPQEKVYYSNTQKMCNETSFKQI